MPECRSVEPRKIIEIDIKGVQLLPSQYEVMQKIMGVKDISFAQLFKELADMSLEAMVELHFENMPDLRNRLLARLNEK